jgi:hypothetical protein
MIPSKVMNDINVLGTLQPAAPFYGPCTLKSLHSITTGPVRGKTEESRPISPSVLMSDSLSRAADPYAWYSASIVEASLSSSWLLLAASQDGSTVHRCHSTHCVAAGCHDTLQSLHHTRTQLATRFPQNSSLSPLCRLHIIQRPGSATW